MPKYSSALIKKACKLRRLGNTYEEIKKILKLRIPKSTLSYWFKSIPLPPEYYIKVHKLNINNLNKNRLIALKVNKIKRENYLEKIKLENLPIAKSINNLDTAKIALAMLCLGEASKYNLKTGTSFYLGSSDSKIITIFLKLLKKCFNFDLEKIRCTVQCRADQDIEALEKFWMNVTKIPKRLFYKANVDSRTVGKPTKNKEYKGVLRVDYFDTKVQLELESLADLVYNQLIKKGPEV